MRPPSGNVTFLFSDIEGSSRLWERHQAEMAAALAAHDKLLRGLLESHGGHIFKTMGDAFCVAFAGTADAVQAALAVQQAVSTAQWPTPDPLRIRLAIHGGEAEQRDGDYFGPVLNHVARLVAAGHGGQTLLSRVAAERVREHLPENVSLRDLGERRLKDLSRPDHIFQLNGPGLATEFPPLRSLEVLPNNLPAQVTSYVGREREMAEAIQALETTRLLTLVGPGGTGKTRLSLQMAAEVLERFPHGVWLAEFATVSDSALVPETIANALDIREESNRAALETLIAALRNRQLLLILDNCEHLLGACARAAAMLLRQCPSLRILVTSREALNIDGEKLFPVPPLPTPEFRGRELNVEPGRVSDLASVRLFVERAAAIRPDFRLTPENALLIARICSRLDGLPLAIELAAARIKVLPLEQILARLDDRFRLLNRGSRAAEPRQQTLGALLDWSYDLLAESERILLRRLTVFVGGRTLEMAEAVCAGEDLDKAEVFELLSALVEKSLLMMEPAGSGEGRYTMLESVWDYAEEKLAEHKETSIYRRKHLEYFVQLAVEVEPKLTGPDQKQWLERLATEHFNLNAALRFSLEDAGTIHAGLRLAGALTRYWEVHNYLTEGRELLRLLLQRDHDEISPETRANAHLSAGRLSWCQDRDAEARNHYQTALKIYQSLGQTAQVGLVEALLGFTERNDGNNAAATEHFRRAEAIAREHQLPRVAAMAINGLASIAADQGDFVSARAAKEQSLATFRAVGDQWVVALVCGSLARLCLLAGDYGTAERFGREALTLGRELGNKWAVPYSLELLGDVYARENQAWRAVRLYGAASAQRETLGLTFSTTESAHYQRGINRLHELVSDLEFDAEWKIGRSLPMRTAINLALDRETTFTRHAPAMAETSRSGPERT